MTVLVIDNYDSFVYNLVQYIASLRMEVVTMRNDTVSMRKVRELKPDCMVVSPGPGRPENAGRTSELIGRLLGTIPILGVCLGHQAIAYAFGGRIIKAKKLLHGKTSMIHHDRHTIFEDAADPFSATRYHSLVVERKTLPDCLEISAWTEDHLIMGIRHRNYNIEGVQFHPESILTGEGMKIIKNFLRLSRSKNETDDL